MPKLKLTNEAVARKLGWTHWHGVRPPKTMNAFDRSQYGWRDGEGRASGPPRFLLSIDAIVKEIEARELTWGLRKFGEKFFRPQVVTYFGDIERPVGKNQGCQISVSADSAAESLCKALLEFLKEPHGHA